MTDGRSRKILVTGATGQIGSELVPELRERYGSENVVAAGHSREPGKALLRSGPFESLDAADKSMIANLMKKHRIDTIYHLAGILSAAGEKDPLLAWHVNMDGLHNVLEAARESEARVFWPSSIAVFGPDAPRVNAPQMTALVPRTLYGVTKVAGELLCNYYSQRHGLDVRSLRYPGIISSETPPGGGTTDYAVEIFYEAIKSRRYVCFVREETVLPMLYMPDCIKATLGVMEADPTKIKVRTSYNLGGLSFSAGQLAEEIKTHFPDFVCEYRPDYRQEIADSWPMSVDDFRARQDWGWEPSHDLRSMTGDMIERLAQKTVLGERGSS